jgi:hypothetical protein
MCSLRVLPNTGTTRQPPFYINSASIVGRKIESTVNTQLSFSFSTRPLTLNSQQSTIIPVQRELILLTGMGQDGAEGMSLLRSRGWHTIAQDEKSSVVYGMPSSAVQLNAAVEVLPPEAIADRLLQRVLFK